MGLAILQIRIMPEGVDTNLDEVKKHVEHNIAFGLRALEIFVGIDEKRDQSEVEDSLAKIEHVSSVEVLDYRRAFG